ncbi:MAG: lipoate--protein ligase [Elusimicrobiota bacterium]|jgi:lipoate-protein ligase A|nr:lipoate--protein ligase [Elusimicrobiota bacterium]
MKLKRRLKPSTNKRAYKMIYLESPQTDPYFNLSLEQFVFDNLDRKENYFMLWQNDNAVIIGKNQNTIEEINAAFVKEKNIKVVRRLSGGGAVYHDMGNLNFTFVMDAVESNKLDLSFFCRPIAKALKDFGIDAQISGRNDITIDGKKFSGNAQYLKEGRVMHHGTIMFNSNLENVEQSLNVSKDKIASKGVRSIRSAVTNVGYYLKSPISLKEFKDKLVQSVFEGQNFTRYHFTQKDIDAVNKLRDERYGQWDWNYGKSPAYSIVKKRRVEGCGSVEICMQVDEGIISYMKFYGDFFGLKDADDLSKLFVGRKNNAESYEKILSSINVGDYFNNLTKSALMDILAQ